MSYYTRHARRQRVRGEDVSRDLLCLLDRPFLPLAPLL